MSGRTSRAVNGSVTALIQHALVILLQLIIAPLVLAKSGQDMLGGYVIVMQVIGYGLLLDFGFTVALNRYLAQSHNPASNETNFVIALTVGRNVLYVTNALIAILLVFAAWNVHVFIQDSEVVQASARQALYLMALWVVFRTPLYIYGLALNATQDMAVLNIIGVLSNLVRLTVSLALVNMGFGLAGLVVANILSELFGGITQRIVFHKRHTEYLINKWANNKRLAHEMFRFGLGYWGVNLSVVLLLGSDSLIVGALYGAATASIFYTTKMFGSLMITLISRILDHVYPGMNQLIGNGDFKTVKNIYVRLLRYTLLLALPTMIGIIIFLESFVTLWVGAEQFGGEIMSYFLALFVLVQVLAHLNGITALSLGKLKNWPTISICCGVFSILGGYFIGKLYGMEWVLFVMALSILPLVWFLSSLVIRQLAVNQYDLLTAIVPSIYSALPLIVYLYILTLLESSITLVNTAVMLFAFLLVWSTSTWFIGLNQNERFQIQGAAERFFKHTR